MSKRIEANAALEDRNWGDGTTAEASTNARIAQSVRFDQAVTERLIAESKRRGTTVSDVVRGFVDQGLAELDESATVRLADVQRAIASLVSKSAA